MNVIICEPFSRLKPEPAGDGGGFVGEPVPDRTQPDLVAGA